MKKTIYLILTAFALNCNSQTINNLDEKYGYKDLKFGTPKSQLEDKIYGTTANGNCLVIGDGYRKIRNVTVEQVYMKFTSDKLFAIILTISGDTNVNNLLSIYIETYGKATSSEKKQSSISATWEGKSVILSYDMNVDENDIIQATVYICAKDLLHKNYQTEVQKNKDDL